MDGYSGGWVKPVVIIAAGIVLAGLVVGLLAGARR